MCHGNYLVGPVPTMLEGAAIVVGAVTVASVSQQSVGPQVVRPWLHACMCTALSCRVYYGVLTLPSLCLFSWPWLLHPLVHISSHQNVSHLRGTSGSSGGLSRHREGQRVLITPSVWARRLCAGKEEGYLEGWGYMAPAYSRLTNQSCHWSQ